MSTINGTGTTQNEIKLYNTKTRRKEVFEPIKADDVRMYVCGPTVYDRAHLGNARPVIVFDVLNRLLRHVYGADHVTYVRNFTDVDDRINETAQKRKAAGADGTLEELIAERADETIDWYHQDMDALGALRPDHEPRATAFIGQMIAMIEGLIASGHAYAAEGHALFAVESYKEYGALSGRSVDDMIAGARVEVAPYKRNPMDFVLWKPSPDDLPGWESPWGRGRPGWHIECSAMAHELLGESFDIHGGGNDLQFPHHENEIAQSKCAGHGFANVWMHNEMLQVEGKKMSKSLGNFFTVRDLLEQGVPGEVIRFVMLSTHYRKPMDWTEKKRMEAEKTLRKWYTQVAGLDTGTAPDAVLALLGDDLNTHGVLTECHRLSTQNDTAGLRAALALLGLLDQKIPDWAVEQAFDLLDVEAFLSDARTTAMETKDFSEVDRIKSALIAVGIEVQMSKDGVKLTAPAGFDRAALEGVL
ncbi:cysteine--tRNA ligase [Sulfitobacter geojensis]|uniref:Cysteine--tRNA ligase n=1 Tax=Sulfitobacter geojensis TaxID=1342299 RepID=A0AAE3B4J2_9RHOB|nr:cysteine--tRNA ligase [Sulfitobacter geojensis]MBM1688021.1 cysteine--tRNA ligase [Sulfitobacter geojensis]MBM1692088.1 cysteine--tRNA ligase [Sulfitobacter geojensis]MBM1704254.1 cysteine--tRNA ligase [Sulfitobacter geojensis]MBM1708312.1 cysteine--tRNA ligase [Sulfitobacter geojensis]MBM1712377.1 cysteine--tRNA ligase [Sulfitobacter geojensis]